MTTHKNSGAHKTLNVVFIIGALVLVVMGIFILWFGTIPLPDFKSFEDRKVARSTKIYDRTGTVLLYDLHQDIKRTVVPYDQMGTPIKNATVAIEDKVFYEHGGIRLSSIIRAVFADIFSGQLSQGGSTITQQIVKNTLLTSEKTITRKIKEWILSIKIERILTKEQILEIYLNEAPYGGNIYGVEEAANTYFGKHARELDIAEAAYLASIPKSPTRYSPYGKNKADLDTRQQLVLSEMRKLGFITEEEYNKSRAETVVFKPREPFGIRAPHFVFFIKDYLENKYGSDMVENGGLKVITTLDWDIEQKAEEVVKRYALQNEKSFGAENAALVAIDPKTGQILSMVGSRDYFDKNIDGNFNVATAKRQPGSSFKPIVYAAAFKKGFTPETVIFDTPTEFQMSCSVYGVAYPGHKQDDCYKPDNFDGTYAGPLMLKEALGRSKNVVAVKVLYLTGVQYAIDTARDLGITTLEDAQRYGLSLVLGGGATRLLDMVGAYGVFAHEGVRENTTGILEIDDANGSVLETYTPSERQAIPRNVALQISSIISNNTLRTPTFGANSPLYFPGRDVAVKTGTTNDYRDGWIIGYTPSIAIGVWAGNNDNSPMDRRYAVTVAAPIWREVMQYALTSKVPDEIFPQPENELTPENSQPVLRGIWQGGEQFFVDSITGGLATEFTPKETKREKVLLDVHDILRWIDKDNPRGPQVTTPTDPQFDHWDIPARDWWMTHQGSGSSSVVGTKPTYEDSAHTSASIPTLRIISPGLNAVFNPNDTLNIQVNAQTTQPVLKMELYINDTLIKTVASTSSSISLSSIDGLSQSNTLTVVVYDTAYNRGQTSTAFSVLLPNTVGSTDVTN